MTAETHRVVAAIDKADGRHYILVASGLAWEDAASLWTVADDSRRAGFMPTVAYLVVRSDEDPDPRWADAREPRKGPEQIVRGFSRETHGWRFVEKAARCWARRFGVQGREGGWVYWPDGRNITQGWASVGNWALRTGRLRKAGTTGDRIYPIGVPRDRKIQEAVA